jgi:sarcosine oxidase subunit gamma
MTTTPGQYARRSPLYRWHQQQGAAFGDAGGSCRVLRYPGEGEPELCLVDLSTHGRSGFKGSGARQWLDGQSSRLPASPNRAMRQPDGSLIARLSDQEHLVLTSVSGEAPMAKNLETRCQADKPPGCYALPRADSHCWFMLAGKPAAEAMSRVCAVDLRSKSFADGAVAQTSVAGISAIIIRDDAGELRYHVLADASLALYLWEQLHDCLAGLGGRTCGIELLLQKEKTGFRNGHT